jgi:hypothetical protein
VKEAKVQLGVRVAVQAAQIDALVRQLTSLGVENMAAEARPSRLELDMVTQSRRKSCVRGVSMLQAEQSQMRKPTSTSTLMMGPDLSDILS